MSHRRRSRFRGCFYILGAALLDAQTTAPVPATIDISSTVTTPISAGFSGVSTDLGFPVEYWDYHFNALAATIGFGWVRFPGGTSSDIYNWQTGQDEQSWYSQFPANSGVGGDQTTIALVAGRGGAKLIDAANRANLLGASLVMCVNGFTDTPASAGQLAAYVKANQIQVAAWELSNEPYLYSTFFANATAYLNAMKPYRDAIKAVDPNAVVAIFVTDQAHANAPTDAWNTAVAAYPNKYWDAITYHHYPAQSSGAFSQWMADESAVLVSRTTAVTTNLAQVGPPGVKFLNTEFDPSIPNDASTGASSMTDGTVWGGIYSAEYVMRMSTVPAMLHVGPSEISYNSGVFASSGHQSQVEAATGDGIRLRLRIADHHRIQPALAADARQYHHRDYGQQGKPERSPALLRITQSGQLSDPERRRPGRRIRQGDARRRDRSHRIANRRVRFAWPVLGEWEWRGRGGRIGGT